MTARIGVEHGKIAASHSRYSIVYKDKSRLWTTRRVLLVNMARYRQALPMNMSKLLILLYFKLFSHL